MFSSGTRRRGRRWSGARRRGCSARPARPSGVGPRRDALPISEATKAGRTFASRVASKETPETRSIAGGSESRFHAREDPPRFHAETPRFEEDGMIFPRRRLRRRRRRRRIFRTPRRRRRRWSREDDVDDGDVRDVRSRTERRAPRRRTRTDQRLETTLRSTRQLEDGRCESVAEKTNDTLEDRRGYPRIASRRGVTLAVVARIAGTNRAFRDDARATRRGRSSARRFSPLTPENGYTAPVPRRRAR